MILLLILIVILIFIKLLFYKNENMINNKKWLNYRLGDIIKGYFITTNNKKYLDNIEKNLPNSIGGQYIKLTKNVFLKKNNYELLNKIIDKKIKLEKLNIPNKDNIILHLRIGDVINSYNKKEKKYIVNNKYSYTTNFKKLENILDNLDNKKKIILIFGSHKKKINKKINKNINNKFVNDIKEILKNKNYDFEVKLTGDPDKDLIYMSKSKIFIKSGGYYSRLISDLVKINGGIVYDSSI